MDGAASEPACRLPTFQRWPLIPELLPDAITGRHPPGSTLICGSEPSTGQTLTLGPSISPPTVPIHEISSAKQSGLPCFPSRLGMAVPPLWLRLPHLLEHGPLRPHSAVPHLEHPPAPVPSPPGPLPAPTPLFWAKPAACHAGILVPEQGLNLCPGQWQRGVVTAGPPGHLATALHPHRPRPGRPLRCPLSPCAQGP